MISNKLPTNVPIKKNGETFIGNQSSDETSTSERAIKGDTISIHYTGRLDDGTVFISTENKEPFTFTQGHGEIVAIVQRAVVGMALGESKIVRVSEEDAYGAYHPDLAVQIDRAEFDKRGIKPEIGLEFGMDQTNGESVPVRVTEICDSFVTLDANHPLAGRAITFDLLLVDILPKPAIEE